ncbi:EF-hand 6 domain containing protein, partial [Asbolus verrucosus]
MQPKKLFSKESCKNIVALCDINYTGTLDYKEFSQLMTDVAALKMIFKKFDVDNSGRLNGFELRNLLSACGYKVNKQLLIIFMLRYGTKGSLNFENFVICVFKLKTMIDEFCKRRTTDLDDHINVNRNDWLKTTLYS